MNIISTMMTDVESLKEVLKAYDPAHLVFTLQFPTGLELVLLRDLWWRAAEQSRWSQTDPQGHILNPHSLNQVLGCLHSLAVSEMHIERIPLQCLPSQTALFLLLSSASFFHLGCIYSSFFPWNSDIFLGLNLNVYRCRKLMCDGTLTLSASAASPQHCEVKSFILTIVLRFRLSYSS